jgi:hypothetical protein
MALEANFVDRPHALSSLAEEDASRLHGILPFVNNQLLMVHVCLVKPIPRANEVCSVTSVIEKEVGRH